MTWLRATALLPFALLLLACNSDDTTNGPITPIGDASQPPPTKFEAGSPCATDNDCASGLVCLHPATTCQAYSVCTAAPPSPCDHPQTACSCLGENVQVCDGYSVDAIQALTPCGDGGTVPVVDGGTDAPSAPDGAGPVDAGSDTGGGGNDAAQVPDASDAASSD
jgi:hypothetical protein